MIDHFIQIDFCAFQTLVTAVGGVTVPLPYAGEGRRHRPRRAANPAATRSMATKR